MATMVQINGVRYREEDAKRLGLIKNAKVLTANSVQVDPTTHAPAGASGHTAHVGPISTASANGTTETSDADENPDGRPNKGATKPEWIEYAKAQGKTDEELKDLKRDEIIALFPSE